MCLEVLASFLQALQNPANEAYISPQLRGTAAQIKEAARQNQPGLQQLLCSDDVEEMANSYFQRIYTSEQSIADVIQTLKRFKNSSDLREQKIFACMIHNLFDEYRFFHKYPEKELRITGILFGTLIQFELVSSVTLAIALRYVLEALRKTPGQGSNGKMFRFGIFALEQFKQRLSTLPQYCSHVLLIPHLQAAHPELYAEIEQAMRSSDPALAPHIHQQHQPQPQQPGSGGLGDGRRSSKGVGAFGNEGGQQALGPGADIGMLQQAVNGMSIGDSSAAQPNNSRNAGNLAPGGQQQPQDGLRGTGGSESREGSGAIKVGPITQQQLQTQPIAGYESSPQQDKQMTPPIAPVGARDALQGGDGRKGGGSGSIQHQMQQQQQQVNSPSLQPSPLQGPMAASPGGRVGTNAGAKPTPVSALSPGQARPIPQAGIKQPLSAPDIDGLMPASLTPMNIVKPPEAILDRIHFVINNVSQSNLEQKVNDLRPHICDKPQYDGWIANYLVVKRISTQPNFHDIYLQLLDRLECPSLMQAVLNSVFHNVGKLLRSNKIITSTSERSLLKNLGSWLGQITLARGKPILQRQLDLKELLFQGYETGRLIAVTPFVAKILEGSAGSRIFSPPNPWLMGLLSALHEMYVLDDLKMNIKFEVEMLVKKLGIHLEDVPKLGRLARRASPNKEKNPDFNVQSRASAGPGGLSTQHHQGSPMMSGGPTVAGSPQQGGLAPGLGALGATGPGDISGLDGGGKDLVDRRTDDDSSRRLPSQGQQQQQPPPTPQAGLPGAPRAAAGTGVDVQEKTVIPNLGAYLTINPNITVFAKDPSLKRIVPVAVDRAIREIIQPVVERSVTIAGITAKELVVKDFALEGDETLVRKAAYLMVSNLAGSLALVTCKEPLRVSIGNHIRNLLSTAAPNLDTASVDMVVQMCSSDNLELGCMLIEKAATERAMRDIDEALAPHIQARRKHRETVGNAAPFADMAVLHKSRYPGLLPDALRPKPMGVQSQQLLVYEAFHRLPKQPSTTAASATEPSAAATGAGAATSGGKAGSSPVIVPGSSPASFNSGAVAPGTTGSAVSPAATGSGGRAGEAASGASPLLSGIAGGGSAAGGNTSTEQNRLLESALQSWQDAISRLDSAAQAIAARRGPGGELLTFNSPNVGSDFQLTSVLQEILVVENRLTGPPREEGQLKVSIDDVEGLKRCLLS
jgi:hypothetical protein